MVWKDEGPTIHNDPSISQTAGSVYNMHIINGTPAVNNGSWPKAGAATEDSVCEEVSKRLVRGCG